MKITEKLFCKQIFETFLNYNIEKLLGFWRQKTEFFWSFFAKLFEFAVKVSPNSAVKESPNLL